MIRSLVNILLSLSPLSPPSDVAEVNDDRSEHFGRCLLMTSVEEVNEVADRVIRRLADPAVKVDQP